MAGPALGGGGRFGGGGRRGGPGPPAFLGGSAGVGESFSPGRGARAGGEWPREGAPEPSWRTAVRGAWGGRKGTTVYNYIYKKS